MIVAMPTGRGKTLIGAKIAEYVARRPENRAKSIIILSKSIPLTFQHTREFAKNTGLCVSKRAYCGDNCAEGCHDWSNELNKHEVFCFTAGLFHYILEKGYISLVEVCLLIFDEAHHTRKKSDYRQIMDSFYFTLNKDDRPQVKIKIKKMWNFLCVS